MMKIETAIREALATSLPELKDIDGDAGLTSDLGLDSVQIMNLVMEIEDRLDISIPVNVLSEVRTLNQLATQLEQIVNAQ